METDYTVDTFPLDNGYRKVLEEGLYRLKATVSGQTIFIEGIDRRGYGIEKVNMLFVWMAQGKVSLRDLHCPEAVDSVLRNMALEWNAGVC